MNSKLIKHTNKLFLHTLTIYRKMTPCQIDILLNGYGMKGVAYRVQGVQALNARGLTRVTVGLSRTHQHNLRESFDSAPLLSCIIYHNACCSASGYTRKHSTTGEWVVLKQGLLPRSDNTCTSQKLLTHNRLTGGARSCLDGQGGDNALRVHQRRVAEVVQAPGGEDLRASLPPHRLAEGDAVAGQQLRGDAAQGAQHRPARVDHLDRAVAARPGQLTACENLYASIYQGDQVQSSSCCTHGSAAGARQTPDFQVFFGLV